MIENNSIPVKKSLFKWQVWWGWLLEM